MQAKDQVERHTTSIFFLVGKGSVPYQRGAHGYFVMIAINGGEYLLHLQMKLKKQTADGKQSCL